MSRKKIKRPKPSAGNQPDLWECPHCQTWTVKLIYNRKPTKDNLAAVFWCEGCKKTWKPSTAPYLFGGRAVRALEVLRAKGILV